MSDEAQRELDKLEASFTHEERVKNHSFETFCSLETTAHKIMRKTLKEEEEGSCF